MTSFSRRLIIEAPSYDLQTEHIVEANSTTKRLYVTGRYAKVDEANKNNRIYESSEFDPALKIYDEQFIKTSRAGGELGHSASPEMDLSKLAHRIISLEKDGKYIMGKSMILSTPSGKILENLTNDGLVYGMSTKVLGQIKESSEGNLVKSPIIVGIDAVYDPSVSTAFVNGILENKEYIIGDNNTAYEAFQKLEKHLSKYPSKHRDAINRHILEGFEKLLKTI